MTGHGLISFPSKESLLVIPLHDGGEQYLYRFLNVENLARECAKLPNTITIINFNSCRVLPTTKSK
jgi:hypothetical protein